MLKYIFSIAFKSMQSEIVKKKKISFKEYKELYHLKPSLMCIVCHHFCPANMNDKFLNDC